MTKARTQPMIPRPAAPGVDIADLQMSEEVTLDIVHPANPDIHVDWTIGSQFSAAARKAAMAAAKLSVNATTGEVEAGQIDFDDTLLDQLVAVSRAWSLTSGGAPFPCTAANVRAILTDEATAWMRPQVQTGYLSLTRFFTKANAA